jgi:uncharacterized repeat protein (TIGR03803 family)
MQGKRVPFLLTVAFAIFSVTVIATNAWAAPREIVLHNFNGKDGALSFAGLILDAAGNLYGTTALGGAHGGGTVFELSPKASGGYSEKVLHSFTPNGRDGIGPCRSLTFDAAGNLYGTTKTGGTYDYGTVFELTPMAGGDWTEKVVHNFGRGGDGQLPVANLISDGAGNLYGTTSDGGAYGLGTTFELTKLGGRWKEKVLYSFGNPKVISGGGVPYSGLILDTAGNLYGTTFYGVFHSACNCGTVFELSPKASGGYSEKVLHSFGKTDSKDGASPISGVILDTAGNLYGTTWKGGTDGIGTVFELTPKAGGGWSENVLHNFSNNGKDGAEPSAGLVFDAAGNLYGTTTGSGADNYGTVFELTPKSSGGWTENVLHNFRNNGKDGLEPVAGLTFDTAGNLYGTTQWGGDPSCSGGTCGTVFEIKLRVSSPPPRSTHGTEFARLSDHQKH